MDIVPILSTLRRHKLTACLVILEIALTCAIVSNAVFLITQRLDRIDMPSGVAEHELVQIRLANIKTSSDHKARTAADVAVLQQIPGVSAVASVNQVPFGKSSSNSGLKLDLNQREPTLEATTYFGENAGQTLGVQLISGRQLRADEYLDLNAVVQAVSDGKTKGVPHTVVITQDMAARLWPGQSPLGKQFYVGGKVPVTVVGVVKYLVRPEVLDDAAAQYSMLLPIRADGGNYLLRSAPQDRQRVLAAALVKLKQAYPNRVVLKKQTWDHIRSEFFQNDRAMAGLLVGVCIALLLVTGLGIVGLASFWVSQRRRMIGVRRALGATRGDILRYFQTENLLLATIGIALGMVLAYGINLFLMQHYELPRLPAVYFPIGAIALWVIGQLAVLGPALRAAAVPPVVATRSV